MATLTLHKKQKLYQGCFYKQHKGQVPAQIITLMELNNTLINITDLTKNNTIILSGDFNAADINWDTYQVIPGNDNPTTCDKVLKKA